MSKVLLKYIPETSIPLVKTWFDEYQFHLRITKSRVSKLGDFRPAHNGKPNRISVNGDLNQYQFLITLTHEVAHVSTWQKFKNKVNPHGVEWQNTYSELLSEMMQTITFPDDLQIALSKHLKRPKASSCSDPQLFKALRKYDEAKAAVFLEDLPNDSIFIVHGKRIFKKGAKRRSRYECIEVKSNKTYLISGHAEVEIIENKD